MAWNLDNLISEKSSRRDHVELILYNRGNLLPGKSLPAPKVQQSWHHLRERLNEIDISTKMQITYVQIDITYELHYSIKGFSVQSFQSQTFRHLKLKLRIAYVKFPNF
uniref:Uncharacterized protein n=1 Tax=Solanum lycopersicum TaxID=4081 RepID=A0A3Q7GGM7_SOLLC